jgi:hypothetical protein
MFDTSHDHSRRADAQNSSFAANCICRGVPIVLVIVPNAAFARLYRSSG